ncbi:ATP-binding protein [Halarcobacter ebronensis]|uniref:histidine kinase n=1 Tax=Halarcobacter ebronensis TaxID=1462615 RepID=A0A4Q1AKN7_9BACT|nr:ATP-binding protein [Halarcobacter ebronensis]QKF81521.1 Cache sensor-containing signal transduction histidine kinase [Halarcobacter ebronensis]RXK05451.1 hypothetical protein CRV07_08030 [Halarcobacter ebronensis]
MIKKIILKYLFLYFIITTLLVTIYIIQFNKNVENYLHNKTNQHLLEYKAIYDEYRVLSKLIFDTDINDEKTIEIFKDAYKESGAKKNIIRNRLLNHLKFKYEKLKSYNLKQLHFHLPDNESFLRMHRPNKFGDNLTNVRSTVRYVNENKKYIHGFEEGRIFNGYRFVYPLFTKDDEYIGSVEISFSVLAMVETMYHTYNLNLSFLIRKDVVDKKVFKEERKNYILSPNKDFYFEKSVYETHPPLSTANPKDYTTIILKGEPFSIYDGSKNIIKTMIPIKNPVTHEIVATLCVCQNDDFIYNDKNDLISKIFISYLLLAIVFYLFFKQTVAKENLIKLNRELDKRVTLEVNRGRKQDLHLFNQSKMASLGKMMSNIAHQWRQPLSVITTCASGIKVQKEMNLLTDKDLDCFTNSILEHATYLSKTIDNFKEYIDVNDKDRRILCIQEHMDKVLDFFNPIFQEKNIAVIKKYEEEKLNISANTSEVFEVFNAIFSNAKDAFEKSGTKNKKIVITIKKKNDKKLLITIKDNAGGIDEKIIDKIFDPYFTTKHESMGTGISLYLTYKVILENLKGEIFVKNNIDGAKFYIELPIV